MDSDLGPDDMKRVSHIFISDKTWRHHHAELSHITRKHETIQCLSDPPYIAVLLDLNVVMDPRTLIPRILRGSQATAKQTDVCGSMLLG